MAAMPCLFEMNLDPKAFILALQEHLKQFDCAATVDKIEAVVNLIKDANYTTFFKPEILTQVLEIVALYETNRVALKTQGDDSWIYLAKIRSNVHSIPQIDAGGYF